MLLLHSPFFCFFSGDEDVFTQNAMLLFYEVYGTFESVYLTAVKRELRLHISYKRDECPVVPNVAKFLPSSQMNARTDVDPGIGMEHCGRKVGNPTS